MGTPKRRFRKPRKLDTLANKRSVSYIKKPNVLLVDDGAAIYVDKHVEPISGLPMLGKHNFDLAGHNLFRGNFIADLLDVRETPTGDIVHKMQYIRGSSLDTHLADLALETKINIGCDMIESVAEIHGKELIHADVKLENFVFDGVNAILVDFDSLNHVDVYDKHAKQCSAYGFSGGGTHRYAPPEQFIGCVVYGSDIYSLGISLGELFYGQVPERKAISIITNDEEFAAGISNALVLDSSNLPYDKIGFPKEKHFLELLKLTLESKPDARPSASDLKKEYKSIFGDYLNK